MYRLGAQTELAAGNDKCCKGVLERPKQRGIIVFRDGRWRGEGDEIRGIKAAMHALHPIIIPPPAIQSPPAWGWAINRASQIMLE